MNNAYFLKDFIALYLLYGPPQVGLWGGNIYIF